MERTELKSLDVDVINFILQNNTATIEDLCNCFEVSQVNIRNVLARVEEFVRENNLGILIKENTDYFFENNILNLDFDYTKYQTQNIEKRERIVYIFFKLIFEKSINLSKISRELDISRVTLNGDIDTIKEYIKKFDLKLLSVQWKGIFLEGDPYKLEKFSILFLTSLFLQGYFTSNLKKVVNPLVFKHYRRFIDEETDQKITDLTNKFYNYFNIQLGSNYYYMLKALIVFIHHESKQEKPYKPSNYKPAVDMTETIYGILTEDEKELLGDNTLFLTAYFSQCVYEKYIPIYSFDMKGLLKEFFSTFNLQKLENTHEIANELAVFVNNTYFQNKFLIPAYTKYSAEIEEKLNRKTSKAIMSLFDKYGIPYRKLDIIFMYHYIKELVTDSRKQNVLIIGNGSLNWKSKMLRNKIINFEIINDVDLISYFNFKFYFEKYYNEEKYKTYVFIDIPYEKSNNYENKNCIFINSYDLMIGTLDLHEMFSFDNL